MRVGILGGTFDPVHVGHLIIAEEALSRLALDQVLFIPAGQPWLKADQVLSAAEHRLKMVELAIASNPRLGVSRIEIDRAGPTYTVDTLEQLKRDLGEDVQLFFILGLDALEQFHRWEQPERIIELCELAIASRPGFQNSRILDEQLGRYPKLGSKVNFLAAPVMDISGSSIRLRASEGRSIKYRVPEAVERYVNR
ncbi:MAG: nicotinate-nucleotide adenylyltransferase, partial [Chloroflexi bacterium]|nr:nicotinate-nucleotide adenylyltransferase [Chloroflexota bacterium]